MFEPIVIWDLEDDPYSNIAHIAEHGVTQEEVEDVVGNPDNAVIFAGYLGSLFMAGAFLALGAAISAVTRNQVIAFILTVVICFALLLAGWPMVLDLFRSLGLGQGVVDAIAGLSFLTHFSAISKGVIDLRDLLYFLLMIGFWLYASVVVIDLKKAD